MRDSIIRLMVFIIAIATFLFITIQIAKYEKQNEIVTYNNGFCNVCGGRLHFTNASHYRERTYYYYVCDNCGNIIETNSPMTQEVK